MRLVREGELLMQVSSRELISNTLSINRYFDYEKALDNSKAFFEGWFYILRFKSYRYLLDNKTRH